MTHRDAIKPQLSLLDSTAIIVGIIIGVGFYGTSPFIATCAGGQAATLAAWVIGGLMALVGAVCYAELATTYPQDGGEYVYLSRAYGPFWGFLYAWAGFWIIRPASIGALALVFGQYAHELLPLTRHDPLVYALGSVAALTALNMLGVQTGKWTQNVLTGVKVLGLLLVFAVGLSTSGHVKGIVVAPSAGGDFSLALILVMWAYGGWNEMASVAAEVRNPARNIMRALVLGTAVVMAIYVLGTLCFTAAVGFDGLRNSHAIAADVMRLRFPGRGAGFISALVAVSCLGANNGLIFTGARVYYALGSEHKLYRWLGHWNRRTGTPLRALVAQGIVTLALTAVIGRSADGFERLVIFTAPVFWSFLLLTGVSLFVLRARDPDIDRPYQVAFYPLTPAILVLACGFMLYSSVTYAGRNMARDAWIMIAVMAAGVLAAIVSDNSKS